MNEPRRKRGAGYSYSMVRKIRDADPALIGVKLGALCIERDIPVAQVAADLGVSRVTVYTWFTGQFHPKPEMAARIERLLMTYSM